MDYLTLIPFFIDSEMLNPLMSLRVVCIWRLFRVFPTTISPVVRSVLKLVTSIVMLVYISAAFLLAVEPEVMKNFVTACYFATVTISTVGYGDIHMNHNAGRILVIAIILTAFVFIPWQGYFLSKIIAMTPMPWQRSLDVDVRKYRHVVLMGKITKQRVSMFLREFLVSSNETNYRVVILDSEDQGAEFEKYIKDSGYWKKVRYYVGSPTADHDLHRVHLAEASAAFVWADTTNPNPEQADRMAVLTCLAIKSHSYWLKVFVEVILPETKARIGEVGPNMNVMSYLELKSTSISRACEVEGLLAFFSVLLTTFGPPSTASTSLGMDGSGSSSGSIPSGASAMQSSAQMASYKSSIVEPMATKMTGPTPLGALPGHASADHHAFGPSPAQLAEAALRRGESHDARIRAAFSGRGPSYRTQPHRTHGSHRSFHYTKQPKIDKITGLSKHSYASSYYDSKESRRKSSTNASSQSSSQSSFGPSSSSSKQASFKDTTSSMPIYPSSTPSSIHVSSTTPFAPVLKVASLKKYLSPSDAAALGEGPQKKLPQQQEDLPRATMDDDDGFDEPTATIVGGDNIEMKSLDGSSGNSGMGGGDRPSLENAYREYLWTRTCTVEILVMPATFSDRTFSEASSSLYSTYGVLLIGVRAMSGQLQLNPGPDYEVQGGEAAYLIGRPRDVRLLKQTFERMARDDGTGFRMATGKTLEYALDPRLEHSPFAPRSLRKSAADDSFVESVQAAAAVTIHDIDPFEALKTTHHILDKPRSYQDDATHLPKPGGGSGRGNTSSSEKETKGPRTDRWHTFAPHTSTMTPSSSSSSFLVSTGGAHPSAIHPSAIHHHHPSLHHHPHGPHPMNFGPPTPASRPRSYSSSKDHISASAAAASVAKHGLGSQSTSPLLFGSSPLSGAPSSSSQPHLPHLHHQHQHFSSPPGDFSPSGSILTSPLAASPPVNPSDPYSQQQQAPPKPSAPTHDFPNGLTDHIIFCSHTAAVDWHSFIKPLRSRLVTLQRAVVIVTEYEIEEEQWEWLSYFPNVFVVEGSPLVASDLARAQIETCHTIIVLSSPRVGEDEAVLDEKAIVVYNSVRAHFSHKRILLDLAKPTNSRLVAPEVGRVGMYENPEFIAGHLYDCSLHDTIMAKSFDMPFLMELMQVLLTVQNSGVSLVTVPVPEQCRGAHFDSLFTAFPDCVPVGLLRRNPIPALRKFPYVCICPPQTALIGSKDQVYLLAPTSFMLNRASKYAKRRASRASAKSAKN